MSRWISKYPELEIKLSDEVIEFKRTSSGNDVPVVVKPPLLAQFKRVAVDTVFDDNAPIQPSALATLSRDEIDQALAHYGASKRQDGTPKGLGAIPLTVSGRFGGKAFKAYDPVSTLGLFDTEWLDPADRAFADARLRGEAVDHLAPIPGVGVDRVEVTPPVAVAPWPNYDKLKGRQGAGGSVAAQVKKKIVEDGYDAALVAKYERATKNRADVLEAIGEAAAEQAAAPVSDDDIVVEVR